MLCTKDEVKGILAILREIKVEIKVGERGKSWKYHLIIADISWFNGPCIKGMYPIHNIPKVPNIFLKFSISSDILVCVYIYIFEKLMTLFE